MGDPDFVAARELVRDRARARVELYADTAETVRAEEQVEILDGLDALPDVDALTDLVNAAAQRSVSAIAADGVYAAFGRSLMTLEDIEMWMSADIPERWRPDVEALIDSAIGEAQAAWKDVEAEARSWDPAWQFDDDVVRETRHRRLLPVPQSVLERRLVQHRTWVRGE